MSETSDDILTAIIKTFKRLDVGNEGIVEARAMKQCFQEVLNFSESDIAEFFAAYADANGTIQYETFLESVFECEVADDDAMGNEEEVVEDVVNEEEVVEEVVEKVADENDLVDFDFLPDDPAHLASLEEEFCGYTEIDETAHRGITLEQLMSVISFSKARVSQWRDTSRYSKTFGNTLEFGKLNLYHLNAWVIMPSTKKRDCAFVELVASAKQTPKWFISHWWGEVHLDFVNCVSSHMEVRSLPQETCYWVCAYANRQHSLTQEVVQDPRQTSFYKAIRLCVGILLVLDDAKPFSGPATPFTRIWCAFEESVALDQNDDLDLQLDIACCKDATPSILTDGLSDEEKKLDETRYFGAGAKAKMLRESMFPLDIVREGLAVKLEDAQASVDSDRNHILNAIAEISDLDAKPPEKHDAYDLVNQMLRGVFARAAWPQAVRKDMVTGLKLPEVLAGDVNLISLCLSFATSAQMGGNEMALLGQGLPPQLRHLHLDFTKCLQVGDAGITALARCFPSTLESLRLLVRHCWQISDSGIAGISSYLPQSLKLLEINAASCDTIQDLGIFFTGSALTSVVLNFDHCKVLSDRSLAVLAKSLPRSLEVFQLSLQGCSSITEVGLAALGYFLPVELRDLQVTLSFSHANDAGLASLAPAIAKNTALRVLKLDFACCPKINDAGVVALTKTLPVGLTSLILRVDQCGPVSSQGIAAAVKDIPKMSLLKYLHLPVCGSKVDDSGALAVAQSLPSGLEEFQVGNIFWQSPYLSKEAMDAFTSLASIRNWRPTVQAATPSAEEARALNWTDVMSYFPMPIGKGEPLFIAPLSGPLEDKMAAERLRKFVTNYVESISPEVARINIPKPCKNLEADTDDDRPLRFDVTGLKPMQFVVVHFSGIHNEKYIGIYTLQVFARTREIDYKVSSKGRGAASCQNVLPSVGNWWAVAGEEHDLFLDLGASEKITEVALFCPNESATPKKMIVSENLDASS